MRRPPSWSCLDRYRQSPRPRRSLRHSFHTPFQIFPHHFDLGRAVYFAIPFVAVAVDLGHGSFGHSSGLLNIDRGHAVWIEEAALALDPAYAAGYERFI